MLPNLITSNGHHNYTHYYSYQVTSVSDIGSFSVVDIHLCTRGRVQLIDTLLRRFTGVQVKMRLIQRCVVCD